MLASPSHALRRAAIASSAALLIAATPAAATSPGQNGKLVWSAGPSYDLWSMNPDGSAQALLFGGAGDDRSATFSPDGTKIAFAKPVSGWGFEIMVANADGSGAHQVRWHSANDVNPTFSPDGTQVAFASNRVANNIDIWVANVDGSGSAVRLTSDKFSDTEPAWSPDGSAIAFVSGRSGTQGDDIFLMDPDGSNQRNVTATGLPTPMATDRQPDWTPDGQLLWSRAMPGGSDLFVMRPDGTGKRNVTAGTIPYGAYEPVASPDGTQVAFLAGASYSAPQEVYRMPLAGGPATRLTNDTRPDNWPTWQPLP